MQDFCSKNSYKKLFFRVVQRKFKMSSNQSHHVFGVVFYPFKREKKNYDDSVHTFFYTCPEVPPHFDAQLRLQRYFQDSPNKMHSISNTSQKSSFWMIVRKKFENVILSSPYSRILQRNISAICEYNLGVQQMFETSEIQFL